MITGVYKIENINNGKFYIGSAAKSFRSRESHHFGELKRGVHPNRILQRSFIKHGESAFVFSILAYCPPEHCLKIEQWYIDKTFPQYNICKIAGSTRGVTRSLESRKKQSASIAANPRPSRAGFKHTEETKRKFSVARKGVPTGRSIVHTQETKDRISKSKKGCKISEEAKQKISEFFKGRDAWNKGVKMPTVGISNTKRLCIYQYQIKTPTGEIVSTDNLFQFSKDNNVDISKLSYTLDGVDKRGYRVKSAKGYNVISKVLKTEQNKT
jgi:group I intron endonuclease